MFATTPGMSIIAVVGRDLMTTAIGAPIFQALEPYDVSMVSLGRSNLNLSVVVPDSEARAAVLAIHRNLFENPAEDVA